MVHFGKGMYSKQRTNERFSIYLSGLRWALPWTQTLYWLPVKLINFDILINFAFKPQSYWLQTLTHTHRGFPINLAVTNQNSFLLTGGSTVSTGKACGRSASSRPWCPSSGPSRTRPTLTRTRQTTTARRLTTCPAGTLTSEARGCERLQKVTWLLLWRRGWRDYEKV